VVESPQLVFLLDYTYTGSLLLRFYDPTAGKITLNGIDIREYSVKQVFLIIVNLTIVSTAYFRSTTGAGAFLRDFGREYSVW
jgi:hypothetical protein